MTVNGNMLIGREAVSGSSKPIHAVNPATGETLEPTYAGGTAAEVERACELAEAADTRRHSSSARRFSRRRPPRSRPSATR